MPLEATDTVNTGNTFQAKFKIIQKGNGERFFSHEYNINNLVTFQIQSIELCTRYCFLSISFKNISGINKKYTIIVRYMSVEKTITLDTANYLQIGDIEISTVLNLSIQIESWWPHTNFLSLHDDEELTDFEMRGENGSVRVHKVALAAASPVMRRMLCGEWKETVEGRVEIQATRQTLLNLKHYIYCSTVPATELELQELLLVATRYCITALVHKCCEKMVDLLNNENTFALLEFALANKINELVLTILKALDKVKVNQLSEYYEKTSGQVDEL